MNERSRIFGTLKLVDLVNWILAAAGVICLCSGTVYMVIRDVGAAGTGVATGLILLFAATIDRFELLKGLGIEAKTRELRETINQADVVVSRMKRLAEVTSTSLIRLHARTGRFGSATTPIEGHELANSIRSILEGVGADPHRIRQTLEPWAQYAAMDVGRSIVVSYQRSLVPVQRAFDTARDNYPKPIDTEDPLWRKTLHDSSDVQRYVGSLGGAVQLGPISVTAQTLKRLMSEIPSFVPSEHAEEFRLEVRTWLPEIEYLDQHLDFRDPAMWADRINRN